MLLSSFRKINNHSSMLLFVFLVSLIMKSASCLENENACFVCGPISITPLIEYNKTFAGITEQSCEHFDKLLPHEREAYEIDCPRGMNGCITKIQSNNLVMRTCSDIKIDDCKKVNGDLVCLCSKRLCNGEISDNIRKMFNNSEEEEEEDDNEEGDVDDDDDDAAESGDDDDAIIFEETVTNAIESSSADINEVLMSTVKPSVANKAVSSQLSIFYVLIFLQSFVINNF